MLKRHGLGLKKLGTGIQPPRNLTEVIIQRVLIETWLGPDGPTFVFSFS